MESATFSEFLDVPYLGEDYAVIWGFAQSLRSDIERIPIAFPARFNGKTSKEGRSIFVEQLFLLPIILISYTKSKASH